MRTSDKMTIGYVLFVFIFFFTCVAAWATHVITCIQNEKWLFLIAGAIAAPVGVVHGFGIWLGVW